MADIGMAYLVLVKGDMTYILMAYIVMAFSRVIPGLHCNSIHSNGLYSDGLCSYGTYCYGKYIMAAVSPGPSVMVSIIAVIISSKPVM